MGVVQRRITGRSVYEGIRMNGVAPIRGRWFDFDESGKPVGACVLGTAALNLHIAANSDQQTNHGDNLVDQLNKHGVPETSRWYWGANGIGDTIIHWYDDHRYTYNPITNKDEKVYTVPDEEVDAMVRDLLTPVWNEEFVVDSYEFTGMEGSLA